MKCECGAEMILRTSKFDNGLFWGCSNYPRCKSTKRYTDEEEQKAVSKLFQPTPEQEAIFDFIKNRKGNLLIQAVAGSGKTTTIVESLRFLPTSQSSVFLAFNKSIADTLAQRAPSHVDVRTLHSLGFRFIKRRYPNIELDKDKMDHILDNLLGEDDKYARGSALKLYSLCVNNDLPLDRHSIEEIADYYGLELPEAPEYYHHLLGRMETESRKLYEIGKSVSFDDLILRPAWDRTLCGYYDNILVDEVQDLNRIQIRFILNCADIKTSMVIGVGDRAQSIYGFRGADSEAMDVLKQKLNAEELPLSVCFRCPTSHITMAQNYVPQITARPGAPLGNIWSINEPKLLDKVEKEDLVICRLNAPLLPSAFKRIRMKKPAYVKGKDIAGSIVSLLQKEKGKDNETAIDHIVEVTNRKVDKLTQQNKLGQAAFAMDVGECAVYFLQLEWCPTVEAAIQAVGTLFQDAGNGIVLSSIHKAKGLEAGCTFIINFDQQPMPTKSQWERKQELNLMYVALTRSKQDMYFVSLPRI